MRRSPAVSAVRFGDPVPDRLGGGFEHARQILRVAAGADRIDHPPSKPWRVRGACLGIRFSLPHSEACRLKARCTRSNRRVPAPRRREEHGTLVAARTADKEPAFIADEEKPRRHRGTLSKAVRVEGLRRGRTIGAAKTGLQQVLAAAAVDLRRIADGIAGYRPAQTRRSASIRPGTAPSGRRPFASLIRTGTTSGVRLR